MSNKKKTHHNYIIGVLILMLIGLLAGCRNGNGVSVPADISNTPTVSLTADNADKNSTTAPVVTVTPTPLTAVESLNQSVQFSLKENFYQETQELVLYSQTEGTIYYTLDGSTPNTESQVYQSAITLAAGKTTEAMKVYPVSACVYGADGTSSEICVHTYFMCKGIEERFNTYVVSITSDPYNLYDYEYGIFVGGKIMDDYLAEHPNETVDGKTPANYHMKGDESERPVYVEILSSDGTTVINQDAGIRTYGGWSRSADQIPMKLFARKEYSTVNNKFRFPFFSDAIDEKGKEIDAFKRLVLRAAGNDNGVAFIREELFQTLAKAAGYEAKSVCPCAVFVNGEYYGAYWLTEVYHESYFETHYGKFDGTVIICEGTVAEVTADDEELYAAEEFNELYSIYSTADLTDDKRYEELCEKFDVKNYLEYFAYQIFLGNKDWPHNNYKVYRYYAADGEEYGEAPFDGKWHSLLHDLDFTVGVYGAGVTERFLADFLNEDGSIKLDENEDRLGEEVCALFDQLMRRPDCREIFNVKMLDLINGVFADEYLNSVLEELNASRLNEQTYSFQSGKLASWLSVDWMEDKVKAISEFVHTRRLYAYNTCYSFFNLQGTRYTLTVEKPENCTVSINSWSTDDAFSGQYYSDYDTVLYVTPTNGKEFDHWIVDGRDVYTEQLVITDEMINGTLVDISVVMK